VGNKDIKVVGQEILETDLICKEELEFIYIYIVLVVIRKIFVMF